MSRCKWGCGTDRVNAPDIGCCADAAIEILKAKVADAEKGSADQKRLRYESNAELEKLDEAHEELKLKAGADRRMLGCVRLDLKSILGIPDDAPTPLPQELIQEIHKRLDEYEDKTLMMLGILGRVQKFGNIEDSANTSQLIDFFKTWKDCKACQCKCVLCACIGSSCEACGCESVHDPQEPK